MIEYVKGQIAELTPAIAVIDCHGVGYGLNISLNTFSALQGKQEAKLYVYEAIREDAYELYGFSTRSFSASRRRPSANCSASSSAYRAWAATRHA